MMRSAVFFRNTRAAFYRQRRHNRFCANVETSLKQKASRQKLHYNHNYYPHRHHRVAGGVLASCLGGGLFAFAYYESTRSFGECESYEGSPFSMFAKCEMKLITGNAHPALAKEISEALGVELTEATVSKFKNGESRVAIADSVRDCDCFIIQPTCYPDPNDYIIETLIMVDTLRRGGAARVTLVMPYYAYARQSHKQKSRTPIPSKVLADILQKAGVDRIVTIDLHASQIQGFVNYPIDNLSGIPILRNYLLRLGAFGEEVVVVSSSPTHAKMAESMAKSLGSGFALGSKVRKTDTDVEKTVLVGDVENKICVVVSDMVDTGSTFCRTAAIARENGAKHVVGAAIHGIFSGNAVKDLSASKSLDMVVVLDTVPCIARTDSAANIVVLSTGTLLAHAIWRIHMGGSLSALFSFDSAAHIAKPIAHVKEGDQMKRLLSN